MTYVRRHWLSSIMYVVILAMGLVAWFSPAFMSSGTIGEARAQQAEEAQPPDTVDPYLYTRVQQLRQEMSLTTLDLAAMGCNEESATRILESLKSWCVTNKATLDQSQHDELQANTALREAIRLINVGTDDTGVSRSLPSLQYDLAELYSKRQIILNGLAVQLETGMDAFQRQTWQSARKNAGLPNELRYVPGLTDQHQQSIRRQLSARGPRVSRSGVLVNELTWSQKQAVDATRVNITTNADAVRAAESAVLPVPELLKPDPPTLTDQQR